MARVLNIFLKNTFPCKIVIEQVRFYPRWSHRTPRKVYTAEEYENIEKQNFKEDKKNVFEKYGGLKTTWQRAKEEKKVEENDIKFKIKPNKSKPLVASFQKSKVTPSTDMLETVIDAEGNFVFTKMKNNDQRVGTILTNLKSKKQDKNNELMLLEGKRIIKDALTAGCQLKYLLFSRKSEVEYLKPLLPKIGAQLYKMPYKEMQMWSDLTTTPGIMGIFKIPNTEDYSPKNPLPITVICDNIREPGNLGTILRICAGVGCENLILTKGCVDLWDSKVLRSSMGAHFKLKINKGLEWNEIKERFSENFNFFVADNKIISDAEKSENLMDLVQNIPLLPYYSVNFSHLTNLVVIVGGETLGLSKDSYELAMKTNGARLNIPLSNEIDSLNVGAALGIIVFEIKKQLSVNK